MSRRRQCSGLSFCLLAPPCVLPMFPIQNYTMDRKLDKIPIFQEYNDMHKHRLTMPLKGHLLFLCEFQEASITYQSEKTATKPPYKQKKYIEAFEERYLEAYETQTVLEKLHMYIRMISCLSRFFNQVEEMGLPAGDVSCDEAYTRSYNLKIWKKKLIRLDFSKGQLYAMREQDLKVYELKNYLIRESNNKEYYGFVLEAINTRPYEKCRVVRIGFRSLTLFEEWFSNVKMAVYKSESLIFREELALMQRVANKEVQKLDVDALEGIQSNSSKQHKNQEVQKEQENEDEQDSNITIKTAVRAFLDKSANWESVILNLETASQTHRHINILSQILPSYQLQNLSDVSHHETVLDEGETRIFRDTRNQQRYKLFVPLQENDLGKIFVTMTNVQRYSEWNSEVEEAAVKNVISFQNIAIIHEKHRALNSIYRARDFLFLRHVFRKEGNLYMVDKSISNRNFPEYMTVVRGQVEAVWGVIMKDEEYSLIIDLEIHNQGYISEDQDHNLTMKYLKELIHLKERVRETKVSQSVFELFDMGWRVDSKVCTENPLVSDKMIQSEPVSDSRKPSRTVYEAPSILKSESKTFQTRRRTIHEQKSQLQISQTKGKVQTPKITLLQPRLNDFKVSLQNNQPSASYEFDGRGMVMIPQNYLHHRYSLTPSPHKPPKLQEAVNGHAIWKGEWKFDKNGGIIFINKTKLEYQKGVFKYVLSKIAKNFLFGKSILSISLPVDIFACETNLERFAYSMTYAPVFLEKAFRSKSPYQRFKWVAAYGLTNSILYLNMEKPFNPILGETFQGWINGCPVYLEQISHHPPIAAFQFIGRGYQITGSLESKVEMQVNSGCGYTDGVFRIVADDGADFNFITPGGEILGITFGDRHFNLVGKYYVWSKRHLLFLEVTLDASKKGFFSKRDQPTDYMEGNILEVTREFIEDFEIKHKKEKPQKEDIVINRGKVTGVWDKIMKIEGQTYLDLDKDVPCVLQYDPHLLASDGNFREDLAYKRKGDTLRAQIQKQRLEDIQRNDRKLRQKHAGKKH